jgi:hypothetical protein
MYKSRLYFSSIKFVLDFVKIYLFQNCKRECSLYSHSKIKKANKIFSNTYLKLTLWSVSQIFMPPNIYNYYI